MRKLTTVGLLLLVFVGLAMGQVTLSLPTQTAANGTALALPVQVTGFNHVGSFSLTISFDKNVLTYTGPANQPAFGIFNSTPAATANTNGSVSISWFNVSPALNIGSGTLLNLLFTYTGGTSALAFTSTTPSSITDSLGTNLTATYTNGSVSGLPATITIDKVTADPGDVFVPVSGANLKGLGSISLRIAYDTSKATFVGLTNPALPFNAGTPTAGIVALSWFSTTPYSLNSGKLTDLHFMLKNDSTDLTIQGTSQITDSVGNNVTITYVHGKIVKTPAPPLPPVGFTVPTVRGIPGKDVSAAVNVTRMNNIGSISLKITYDQTKLTFKQVANFAGSGFVTNASNGVLSFAWFGTTYLNIGTGKLMDLVFSYSGGSSAVGFSSAQSLVTDSVGNTLSLSFTNGAVNQDSIPHFTAISAKTVAQNDSISFAVLATDADAGDALTYSAGTLPGSATFDATAKIFSWKTSFATIAKAYDVWFYVMDPVGGMDSTMATITVTAVSQKPSFVTTMRDTTIAQGVTLTFAYTASDPNGDALTFSGVGLPTGATLSAAGVLSWKPAFTQVGAFVIKAFVSDGSFTDSTTATVTVTKANQKPAITAKLADATIPQAQALTFSYTASDPNGDPVTFSLASPPAGAAITSAGVFSWTPTYKQVGAFTITAVATDGALTDTAKATITVTKVNVKPVISFRVPAQPSTVSQKLPQTFAVSASDPNGDALTYAWKVNNVVVKPSSADTFFTVTFTDAHGTAKFVTAVVSDGALEDTSRWSFTITDVAKDDGVIPTEFGLAQNYPNPFNPTTTIRFDLPKESPVTLEIYNVLGVKVRTLMRGQAVNAGRYTIVWDGKDEGGMVAPSGIYLYRISAADFHSSKKMTLLK